MARSEKRKLNEDFDDDIEENKSEEEYTDPKVDADLNDDAEYSDDNDDDDPVSHKRGRSRRSSQRVSSRRSSRKVSTPAPNDIDEQLEELEDEQQEEADYSDSEKPAKKPKSTPRPKKAARGRKPMTATPGPVFDDDGKELDVKDDEYLLAEDEEGEAKISKLGELQGGRQFKVRSFTVKGKGDRLYMLSTEPARCMGFRDSYLLFQKHKLLYKVVLNTEEKFDLIDRDIIPHSYKGRVIGLVTARSIFREFGAKIIVGGKNITDDYYAAKLRKEGNVVEGELAEPEESIPRGTPYNQNQFVAWHGASSVYHQMGSIAPLESLELKSVKALKASTGVNEENWMAKHALASREFDAGLLAGRNLISKGLKDSYTGIVFVPQLTQPIYRKVKRLKPTAQDGGKLIFETRIESDSLAKFTGLKDVPVDVFQDVVSDDIKNAILRQQRYEKSFHSSV